VECERAGAPKHLSGGPAPCIIDFGTREQKERFLPPIIRGDVRWCQGYSEPEAGSDLAALQTRAASDGAHYIVNGRKIWTTNAHHADWIFNLVRTDSTGKKQEGISFLLVDLKTAGIEIRPIINLAGDHEFNEVVFTDARVPKVNRIGPENEGWTVAKHFLKYEHAGTGGRGAVLRSRLARLRRIAAEECADTGERLIDDDWFRRKIDRVAIAVEAVDMLELRLMCKVSAGEHLGTEGSFIRIRASEVMQILTELMMKAMAYYAMPFQPELRLTHPGIEPVAPEHGRLATVTYLMKRAETIYGGSVEIHRNIISKRLLGL
jgi:acyl-CoA dehydrogenase